jgi:protein-S-isoprenylcysteine O-methyltransferase Ste14
MEIIGKPTIHPLIFYTGKIAGYAVWIILLLSLLNLIDISMLSFLFLKMAGFAFCAIGLAVTIVSLLHLGKSTRLGLPDRTLPFVTRGIYRFSRNPMYIGFGCITLASILYTANIFTAIAGLYSIGVYHCIILNEEKYLEAKFGDQYREYKKRVRRYF